MDYHPDIITAGDRDNFHRLQQYHYLPNYNPAHFNYSGRINNPTSINFNDQHSDINNLYPNNNPSFFYNYYHRNDHYVCSDCNYVFHAARRA